MHLLVVIVNYKTANLTIDCLKSLEDEISSINDAAVVVVENASGDDSFNVINSAIADNNWGGWVELLRSENNLGFAGGNNYAIRPALESNLPPEYVLLLNPDTKILPGAITTLLDFMQKNTDVGIAGSRLQYPDGTPQVSAFRFPTILGEFESMARTGPITKILKRWKTAPPCQNISHSTDWVSGASMMIRRAVFDSIGLLDEKYFMYYEELDFCYRASKHKWLVWHINSSRVIHFVAQASGVTTSRKQTKPRPQYWFNSRNYFFLKNYGRIYALLSNVSWISGILLWKVRCIISNKESNDPPYLLRDFIHNFLLIQ